MKYTYFYFFERRSYHGVFGPEKPVWIEGRLFTTIHGECVQAIKLDFKRIWMHIPQPWAEGVKKKFYETSITK